MTALRAGAAHLAAHGFRRVSALVALSRDRYWQQPDGLVLDCGPLLGNGSTAGARGPVSVAGPTFRR